MLSLSLLIHYKCTVRYAVSKDPKALEIVIHQKGEYDSRYRCTGEHKNNIKRVLAMIAKVQNCEIKVFEVPEKKLSSFETSKSDSKKCKFKRPSQ